MGTEIESICGKSGYSTRSGFCKSSGSCSTVHCEKTRLANFVFRGVCYSVGQIQAIHRDRKREDESNILSEIYLWELAECTIVLMVFRPPNFRALVDSNIRKRGRN